ncbi:MAG: methionyl-tRNA formyltransferase [Thermoleophilia bacterium]
MRVAFAGSPAPAAEILRAVLGSRHEVPLVISQPDRRRGRSGAPSLTPVAEAAQAHGVPCLRPATINAPDVLEALREAEVGALLVVAFGQLLKAPLLDEWCCVNVHFSLLPAYRGAAPVERAIMDGVDTTGVCIMRMDPGLDTGPVFSTHLVPVGTEDDAGTVLRRLCAVGGPALVEAVDAIEAGAFHTTPQPEAGISHAAKIGDDDRVLDAALPAAALSDRIRALSPHIGVRCTIGGQPFKVWAARPVDQETPPGLSAHDGHLLLGCGDGRALEITELQPPSRARMRAGDFLRGWRGGLELA